LAVDVSKQKQWNGPIKEWRSRVEALGCTLTRSPHAYQIATVEGPGVRAIIYPHTQGYGSHHSARVRDHASPDKAAFDRIARALGLWVKNRGAFNYSEPA
jgi:hypothetical protein